MATTYNITINGLQGAPSLEGATNVVTLVSYQIQGVADDGTEAILHENLPCTYDSDNFTAFNDLTENEVKGWITSSNDYAGICARVDEQIQAVRVPTNVEMNKPW